MQFISLSIVGAWVIEAEHHADERGFFARTWCADEFADHGIESAMTQASVSFNHRAGTLRGLHYARPPAREAKLVRCVRGRIHDVMVDLRPQSHTFCEHVAVVLDADRHNAVYIPPGVAHGFQTLEDKCEVQYMMTQAYQPDLADGVRFDDPAFSIRWPLPVTVMSERDRRYPDLDLRAHRLLFSSEAGHDHA
jgi:dTDP-4-dehydrorhamnose 3,5-epimerase